MRDDRFRVAVEAARVLERAVMAWLIARGFRVVPTCDYSGLNEDKAPRFQGGGPAGRSLVLPDLFAAKPGDVRFVEVKQKEGADFTHLTQRWETGIDRDNFEDYREVERITGIPVWLIFLHEREQEVLAGALTKIKPRLSPRFNAGRKGGGVFFACADLRRLCSLDEFMSRSRAA